MQLILKALKGISGGLGFALKMFLVAHLIIDVVFGIVLAILGYLIAADGSLWRGILAVIFGLASAGVLGWILGAQIAISLMIGRLVKEEQIGSQLLTALLKDIDPDLLNESHVDGHTAAEMEAKLNEAAKGLLSDMPEANLLTSMSLWLANRMQRILVWATVKVAIHQCGEGKGPDRRFSMAKLHELLAGKIDDYVLDMIRSDVRKLALYSMSIVASISLLISLGIRQLPI